MKNYIIWNIYWAANHHIQIISNDAENAGLNDILQYIYIYIYIEKSYLKL